MSVVNLELLFPIMEVFDNKEKRLIQQKQRSPIFAKFQGLFLWQKHKFLFIYRISCGRNFDCMKILYKPHFSKLLKAADKHDLFDK